MTPAHLAQFAISLLAPVSLEMIIRKTRNGLYWGCLGILLLVIGKEFVYDIVIQHQRVWYDSGDAVYYLLGVAAAVIVVLTHHHYKRNKKKVKHTRKSKGKK
jgi:hypothetical protein